MDLERLQFLLQRYFDQILEIDERTELATMLLASARARDEFWEQARWHALIRQWGEAEWGRRDAETLTVRPLPAPVIVRSPGKVVAFPRSVSRFSRYALAAAAAIALFAAAQFTLPW